MFLTTVTVLLTLIGFFVEQTVVKKEKRTIFIHTFIEKTQNASKYLDLERNKSEPSKILT